MASAPFTLGIEEEYLLVDQETLDLAPAPDALMRDCAKELENKVSPEFLQCQIEVGTGVCETIGEARADLSYLRRTIKRVANGYGLAPLAVSTHPFADWQIQTHTDKDRYNTLEKDLGGVVRRLLICGMHVHVGLESDDLRIDICNQLSYFLPHLLALSCSSPFWQGRDTDLNSYRLTVFDNLPRTGLPPNFASYSEYQRSVQIIIDSGLIEDTSKIWWDLRPSSRFPTLEARVCDVSPILEHTLSIAALIQSLTAMLCELKAHNQRWRQYSEFLIEENRWRAQRYGVSGGLIDFGRGQVVGYGDLLEEMIALVRPHAEALNCMAEVEGARQILAQGNSATRQRAVLKAAIAGGADRAEAMKEVVRALAAEFAEGL
ncbi:MAG: carboxylate-amine ligase [Hyphomicrobiales bacterium]|nr:carboxylate-amine ligase [Nitratireductor sp.]MCC2095482.1 carboxylate-amine ligase [Hyphomicrobiales bacterium]